MSRPWFLSVLWKLKEHNLRETTFTPFADGTAHELCEWSGWGGDNRAAHVAPSTSIFRRTAHDGAHLAVRTGA